MAARAQAAASVDAFERLLGGLFTAILALVALLGATVLTVLSAFGVGAVLLPLAARLVRAVADRERARLSSLRAPLLPAGPPPTAWREILCDAQLRRDAAWLVVHAIFGLVAGLVGLTIPLYVVQDVTYPLWFRLAPADDAPSIVAWRVTDAPGALVVAAIGLGWLLVFVLLGPSIARLQAWPAMRLLRTASGEAVTLRIAELTASRAATLDAHSAELRRIERSLHDGAQSRMVAAAMLIGAARRAAQRDPAAADEALERAQSAVETALTELRGLVRGILPPILEQRGLEQAVRALAGLSPIRCEVRAELPTRLPAAIEATAYFVIAEALANAARHSGAGHIGVELAQRGDRLRVRVVDDGKGGADAEAGTGIAGIRARIAAVDGSFGLRSPRGGPTEIEMDVPCGS